MSDRPTVDITGLSKAEVLAALFNATAPGGMGFLQAGNGPVVMDIEHASTLIEQGYTATNDLGGFVVPGRSSLYFDYLYGRCLKLDLTSDTEFDPWGFDRDNGQGAAQQVIDRLRATKDVNPPESEESHTTAMQLNAHNAMDYANTPITSDGATFHLGGADVGAALTHAVDRELRRQQD